MCEYSTCMVYALLKCIQIRSSSMWPARGYHWLCICCVRAVNSVCCSYVCHTCDGYYILCVCQLTKFRVSFNYAVCVCLCNDDSIVPRPPPFYSLACVQYCIIPKNKNGRPGNEATMMICTYVAFLWNCLFHTFAVSECESSNTFKLNSSYTTHFVNIKLQFLIACKQQGIPSPSSSP